ncbi:hypothetical protein L2E82_25965 [Cichorium intybus]|uniref:Uncharacterized protein n=1 Tax=Cichorium intybus TaxID=13427 RepID=A0ACB9E4Y5_CICIN|nr:hypothetical protein L2E82_25965 [Cichorium intybus]
MAATSEDTIMEEREELMVSPKLTKHHHPTSKVGRFLKPSAISIDVQAFPFNPPTASSFPEKNSLNVSFNGWRKPLTNWKAWVDRMHSLHQSSWKKAGIEHAVLNSSYEIMKNDDLILNFAETWCHETKTFVFVWGEATMTLEDMMVLGGYSVLGESVLTPVENIESKTVLAKLYETKLEFSRSTSRKADQFQWLHKFKDSGSEIEHEAFLALWLSRFVFPSSYSTVVRNVFPIAVHLARGIRLALAPAVLASIYRDLSLLKAKINNHNDETSVTIWAPLQLLQIWIWERFPKLRPNFGGTCKPMFARWENKNLHIDNFGSNFHRDTEDFCWRPYATNENDDLGNEKKGKWVVIGDCFDEELESWGRCLRVSELVGIKGKCIEQYLPHRVAMQFGMDQDIPGYLPRNIARPKIAWGFYTRPVTDLKLYVPSRFSEPYVTARYMEWWNNSTGMHSLLHPMGGNETKTSVVDESRTERSKDSVGDIRTSNVSRNEASPGNEHTSRMDLETRIKRLEEVFAYLKAKKYDHSLI